VLRVLSTPTRGLWPVGARRAGTGGAGHVATAFGGADGVPGIGGTPGEASAGGAAPACFCLLRMRCSNACRTRVHEL